MNYNTILVIMFLSVIIIILLRILLGPIKLLFKVFYSCMFSGVGIYVFNLIGSFVGVHIGLNILTILTVGILGVPGLGLLLILQTIFNM